MKKKLKLTDKRDSFRPFSYPWAFDAFLQSEQMHWLHTEVPMIEDVNDWKNKLKPEEKEFLTHIFRFFTQGDIDVAGAYVNNYLPVFPAPEVRMMLSSFAAREAIHQRGYALLNDTLGLGEESYNAFMDFKEMLEKNEYMLAVDNKTLKSTALSLARQVFAEGISLFSSFAMLLNFDRFGKMKGMSDIVRWSIRDESIHIEGNSWLFSQFLTEHPKLVTKEFKKEIYESLRTVVELEDAFIDIVFKDFEIKGIDKQQVKDYIRYVADYRLQQLGLKKNYFIETDPLPWVDELVNLPAQLNFFERDAVYSDNTFVGNWWDLKA